jgi:hypothetical protein
MEAASTSETSVNFYQTTRRNNPEDSHLLIMTSFSLNNKSIMWWLCMMQIVTEILGNTMNISEVDNLV